MQTEPRPYSPVMAEPLGVWNGGTPPRPVERLSRSADIRPFMRADYQAALTHVLKHVAEAHGKKRRG